MGALTLKSYPFELRGWDLQKFEGIDPTDGFISNIRIFLSKNQIVQIEPEYDPNSFNNWLTDKGRQFYDGIFSVHKSNSTLRNKDSWINILDTIIKTVYIFDHCNNQYNKSHYMTIVFENISIEILSLLLIFSHNYSFIKLRRAEKTNISNDIESNFQLNLVSNKTKLSTSTLCLLIATNPRYEGFCLNLNLRQRFLKGNFRCFNIGSLINLTFPTTCLGSSLKTLNSIVKGNNLICQNFKFSKNPLIILNDETLKRCDGKNHQELLKVLKYSNTLNKVWFGLNTLNPSIHATGNLYLAKFSHITEKDLYNFSSLYLLNVVVNNIISFKKILKFKLLNFNSETNILTNKKYLLDLTDSTQNDTSYFKELNLNKYFYMPTSMLYENEETFINTEGYIKRTTKLISRKKTKNNWQILRRIFKQFKKNVTFVNNHNNNIITFNSEKISNFRNFINFNFYVTQTLTNLNYYLNLKNKSFVINPNNKTFKSKTLKLNNTKLKYWLDDFFTGGKDSYSRNSLILTNSSRIHRSESTNFF